MPNVLEIQRDSNQYSIHFVIEMNATSKQWLRSLMDLGAKIQPKQRSVMERIGMNISMKIQTGGFDTLESFSQSSGVGISTLRRIVSGVSNPRLSTLKRIAHALNLQVNELLVFSKQDHQPDMEQFLTGKTRIEVVLLVPRNSSGNKDNGHHTTLGQL